MGGKVGIPTSCARQLHRPGGQAGRGRSGFDESVILEAAARIKNGDISTASP